VVKEDLKAVCTQRSRGWVRDKVVLGLLGHSRELSFYFKKAAIQHHYYRMINISKLDIVVLFTFLEVENSNFGCSTGL